MHADDTTYTAIKNGIVVVSGTGPAIRVDGNRLVIRDGPQETPPLLLTRAEASRRLRHVVVCGHSGGFVTFDALRWLRDTGVAFSQLDWDGSLIIASGPRGPDRPALRRAQTLVCSNIQPEASVAITREILRVKLKGQAEVARHTGSADASVAIDELAAAIARETEGSKVLSIEARAASIYWKLWKDVPIRFARRNPKRLGPNARWRTGRSDHWLTFGARASQLTGKPFRATTPGNAMLNYLYALLESEMTVSLDAIEAARPHVDHWLLAYVASSAFANRDFTDLSDGEIRLSHPLNSHLAYTTALWRKVCEPFAGWLAKCFSRAAGDGEMLTDEHKIMVPQTMSRKPFGHERTFDPLAPLPTFSGPTNGRRTMLSRGRFRHDPVRVMCWECGKALVARQRRFCSNECTTAFSSDLRTTASKYGFGSVG